MKEETIDRFVACRKRSTKLQHSVFWALTLLSPKVRRKAAVGKMAKSCTSALRATLSLRSTYFASAAYRGKSRWAAIPGGLFSVDVYARVREVPDFP